MSGSAGAPLSHDLDYLRRIVAEAVRLHPGLTAGDWVMLADLRSYLVWLTIDALGDEALSRRLVPALARLREELCADAQECLDAGIDPEIPVFYASFLYALEKTLSFKHGVDLHLGRPISREEFLDSWGRTRRRLGL